MHVIYVYLCVCTLCDWLYIMCLPAPTHVIRAWQKAVCHDFRCTYTRLHCSLTQCQSVCTVGVSVWFFYGLSLLITLHSTVWILGRMRVGSVVGMLQRSIRKLLIITVITAAHWAAIRERWVANKYAPNIHICSCCFLLLLFWKVVYVSIYLGCTTIVLVCLVVVVVVISILLLLFARVRCARSFHFVFVVPSFFLLQRAMNSRPIHVSFFLMCSLSNNARYIPFVFLIHSCFFL